MVLKLLFLDGGCPDRKGSGSIDKVEDEKQQKKAGWTPFGAIGKNFNQLV